MSKPGFKALKYWFWLDIVIGAVPTDGVVEVVGNGTRENIPTEVVGGSLASD